MLKQTSVCTCAKFKNCLLILMLFAPYLLSALSKVATCYLREHEVEVLDDNSTLEDDG